MQITDLNETIQAYFKKYYIGNEKIILLSEFKRILKDNRLKIDLDKSFKYTNRSNEIVYHAYSVYIACSSCGHGWANTCCCKYTDKELVDIINNGIRRDYFVVTNDKKTIVGF